MALKSLTVGSILADKDHKLFMIAQVGLMGENEYYVATEMCSGARLDKPMVMKDLLALVNEKGMVLDANSFVEYMQKMIPPVHRVVVTELRCHTLSIPAPDAAEALALAKANPMAFMPEGACGESIGKFVEEQAYVIPF